MLFVKFLKQNAEAGQAFLKKLLLVSSYIKGMSTSVRFRSIIVDCGLGCPTRVSGGFLQSWARADSIVFVHHDSAVSIASLRDCGILPVRCAACFISCYILYVLMLCLVLFYIFACFCLSGTYSARRSVVSTCTRALMCTHVYRHGKVHVHRCWLPTSSSFIYSFLLTCMLCVKIKW